MEIKQDTKGTAFRESAFNKGMYLSYGRINDRENTVLDNLLILNKEFSTLDIIKIINIRYLHDLNENLTESKIELY